MRPWHKAKQYASVDGKHVIVGHAFTLSRGMFCTPCAVRPLPTVLFFWNRREKRMTCLLGCMAYWHPVPRRCYSPILYACAYNPGSTVDGTGLTLKSDIKSTAHKKTLAQAAHIKRCRYSRRTELSAAGERTPSLFEYYCSLHSRVLSYGIFRSPEYAYYRE